MFQQHVQINGLIFVTKKLLEEYEIKEEHIMLILKTLDSNYDLIINKSGDGGDVLRNLSFASHYCCYKDKSEDDVLVHSVNSHPRVPARPDECILKLKRYHNFDNFDNNSSNKES